MITIDTREKKRHRMAAELSNIGEYDYEISDTQRVAVDGDYRWPSDITIEQEARTIAVQRKTVSDFVGSIDKLKETMELGRDYEDWDIMVLLIEGEYALQGGQLAYRRGRYHNGLPIASLHNFAFSQQCRGSPVLRTHTLAESARLLSSLHSYTGPVEQVEHGSPQNVLQALPGIGAGKASQLLETFGSAQLAINRVSDWGKLDGFGEKTVKRCEDILL